MLPLVFDKHKIIIVLFENYKVSRKIIQLNHSKNAGKKGAVFLEVDEYAQSHGMTGINFSVLFG